VILIAEDDKQVQKAYERMLRGRELRVCDDGRAALALIEEGLRPSLIISDLDMPHMNGTAFCTAIRKAGLSTPFVLVSGNDAAEALAEECGADGFVMKGSPGSPQAIIAFAKIYCGDVTR
jgi:CheY-like chemotaxis protein